MQSCVLMSAPAGGDVGLLQQVGRGVCAGRRDLLQRRRRRNDSYLADGPDGQEGVASSDLALVSCVRRCSMRARA